MSTDHRVIHASAAVSTPLPKKNVSYPDLFPIRPLFLFDLFVLIMLTQLCAHTEGSIVEAVVVIGDFVSSELFLGETNLGVPICGAREVRGNIPGFIGILGGSEEQPCTCTGELNAHQTTHTHTQPPESPDHCCAFPFQDVPKSTQSMLLLHGQQRVNSHCRSHPP